MRGKVFGFFLRYGVTLAVGAFVALQISQFYFPPKLRTLYQVVQAPYVAPDSPLPEKLDIPKGEVTARLETLEPDEKQRAKLEKNLGAPLPKAPLLSVKEVKELCNGGTLVLSLEPIEGAGGESGVSRVRVDVIPEQRKFFALALSREASLSYGRTFGTELGSYVRGEFTQTLFYTGPALWFVKGGVQLGLDETWHNGYVEVGARVSF